MFMRKSVFILVLFAALAMYAFYIQNNEKTITAQTVESPIDENSEVSIYFCPQDNCAGKMIEQINSANKTVHCAFFDLNINEVIDSLKNSKAEVEVVIDGQNYVKLPFAKAENKTPYMHNKFCIFDDKTVLTGSFNPTITDNDKNNNNVLIIKSAAIAKNYEAEFDELWNGIFGAGEKTKNPKVGNIETYFCPEDWCTNHILEYLGNATSSIYFMTFSFTSDPIGDMLVKKKNEGVEIKGLFDKTQAGSEYSEYEKLENASIKVMKDANPYLMHHKVFIIDNQTVITGSFNPSKNAEMYNDENVVIIKDRQIAERYVEEFNQLTS